MKKVKLPVLFALVFLLLVNLTSFVYAASDELNLPENTDPQKMELPSVFSLFIKLIFSLLVIVVLAYFTMKFLRKNMQVNASGGSIQILDQHALGLNKGIYVTAIGERVYVLGVTDHNINLVTEISEQNVIEEMRKKATLRQEEPIVPTNLTSLFQNMMQNLKKNNVIRSNQNDFKSHIQAQVNKLQNIFDKGREEGKDESEK